MTLKGQSSLSSSRAAPLSPATRKDLLEVLCTSEDLQTSASGTGGKSFCASQSESESFGSVSSHSVLAKCGEQLGSMSNEFL